MPNNWPAAFGRGSAQWLIVFFFLSPFIILFSHFRLVANLDIGEFYWALKNSVWQGLWSGLFSCAGGFWMALGLIFCENRFSKWINFNIFFLLPNFLPNLFILIGLMSLIDPFPMGTIGVVLVHTFINVGLCGVILKEVMMLKLSKLSDVALILGSGRLRFYVRVLLPLLKKDILQLFFLVFATTFSSFAIPLVVGGGKGINLEILIFEKIKIYNDWNTSILISVVQSGILFLFSLLTLNSKTAVEINPHLQSKFLESRLSFYLFFFLYIVFFYSYLTGIWEGLGNMADFTLYEEEIIKGLVGTVLIGLGTGLGITVMLFALTRLYQDNWLHKFLNGYTAPSAALIGFALLTFGPNTTIFVLVKIVVGLSLSYTIYLYKMGFGNFMSDLSIYKERARLLGANDNLVFWRILVPLSYKRILLYSGVAAFWATGDYGVSKMIASRDITLALLSESFLSHYRIGISSLLSFLLLILGVLVFLFFRGVQVVIGRKINY